MTETINRIAGVWFDWQWAMLWQTAVLIGLVAVIDRLIRKRAWPQLRYMLWLLVFVKLVLPPGLTSPLSVTSQVPALAHKAMEDRNADPTRRRRAGGESIRPRRRLAAAETAGGRSPAGLSPVPRSSQPQVESEPLSWTAYAMAVWLAGVVALAAGLHIRLRRLSKEHAASRPAGRTGLVR